MACVERRSMTQLMSMVQALSFVPGYRWHAYHVRFTVVPASAQIGDEAEAEVRQAICYCRKLKELSRLIHQGQWCIIVGT